MAMTTADGIRAATTRVKHVLAAVLIGGLLASVSVGYALFGTGGTRTVQTTVKVPDLALALERMQAEPATFSALAQYVQQQGVDGDCLIYAPGEGVTLFTCKFAPAQ